MCGRHAAVWALVTNLKSNTHKTLVIRSLLVFVCMRALCAGSTEDCCSGHVRCTRFLSAGCWQCSPTPCSCGTETFAEVSVLTWRSTSHSLIFVTGATLQGWLLLG